MSSRFTETDKWKKPWFRKLSVEAKTLLKYLEDHCDIAGFWDIDLDTASYFTGIPKAHDNPLFKDGGVNSGIEAAFKELQSVYIASNECIFIKEFLYDQKNLPLNSNNPSHKGILTRINSHNSFGQQALEEIERQLQEKGLRSPISNGKGNGNSNGNSIKGGVGEKIDFDGSQFQNITAEDIAEWEKAYPAVNISLALQQMAQWVISNPAKGKKKLWRKFITGWLGREQERGGGRAAKRNSNLEQNYERKGTSGIQRTDKGQTEGDSGKPGSAERRKSFAEQQSSVGTTIEV